MAGGTGGLRCGLLSAAACVGAIIIAPAAFGEIRVAANDLSNFSIEELANVEITSVSKSAEPLSDAPAAVYVITHDALMRSGATTIPEILRLAPNLQVAQMNASSYAITARGFNGNAADKLLVLIDGRSVYTPLFGGVQWDLQDVLPENIERIEVISGPGATLWGANAVNGVINIITRKSSDTQGGILDLGAGNRERRASLQYGGQIESDLSYRVYLEGFSIPHSTTSTGANANDGWSKTQGGFRADWTPSNDVVTVQVNLYGGSEDLLPDAQQDVSGGNIQGVWKHELSDGSSIQALAYYDRTRNVASDTGGYTLNTYDIELQHTFMLDASDEIVWGGGYRVYQDQFHLVGNVLYLPDSRTESLADVFAQGTVSLSPSVKVVLGLKLESDPFSALEALPNARVSWKVNDKALLWASISRAVRAPTRFDVDLHDTLIPSILILTGDRNFQPEKLNAYEIGSRVQLTDAASFSVSAFYNVYDDIRSVEIIQQTTLPFMWGWGNLLKANTYGVEAWGSYGVTDWWRLTAGFNIQHQDRRFKAGSSGLGGVASAGDDPNHQASLRSSMNIGDDVTWDADLRWIGILPDPQVPAYAEFNTRVAWEVSKSIELSLSGFNLLHAHHLEYELAGATSGTEIQRSFFIETKLRF